MYTKASGFVVGIVATVFSIGSIVGMLEAKPKPKDPAHFRVCVQSESEGTACSARLWNMADAEMIQEMFLQAPIPCPYGVMIQDVTKAPAAAPPHQQDRSNEIKVRWQ